MTSGLRIGIDGRMLGPRPKGIVRYIWELCKALDRIMPEAQFFVYSRKPIVPAPSISSRWHWRSDQSPGGASIPNSFWCAARLGFVAEPDNLDVFWGGTGLLPLAGMNTRTVLTVHDLVHKLAPETSANRALWAMRLFFGASVRRADAIVSNSLGTAERLQASYHREVAGIIRPGLTETIRPRSAAEVRAVLQHHGLAQPYLLSVGTLEPRKGLHRLVPAFVSLAQEGQLNNHRLVLVGDRGWKDGEIARLVRSSERILPLGFVDDDSLAALYTGAEALVFPSSYEGFGMPVLEARACGAPVVTTDIPELREAGGEGAIYTAATVEGVRGGILKALRSDRPKPLCRTDHSWMKSAEVFANVLAGSLTAPLAKSI